MGRRAEIIGRAADWSGVEWDVRERRPSRHGFDVMIGWPHGEPRGQGGRGVAVILTVELARYLIDTRPREIDLPIGLTAAKRLRRVLGVSWSWDDWWQARSGDLLSMTLEAFAARHGCSTGAASQRRKEMSA
ncbi:MAG: hypothetical protein KKD25_10035 [Gammaproteobacteria bacterium]|jgi:hypothetical protein|nr:hypothetical protein [Gammaproteobacteria bacterium]MBU0855668.1 hypothetical protein [Gammaproteobacteria bacterium]MBU1847063.1 hypothetical protein [Gammaproteobacteria bacterium]